MGRLWTEFELEYLKKHYREMNTKEIAEHLNRTMTAVSGKASTLKLQKEKIGERYKWTKEEVDYLETRWGTISIPSIAKKLGRTVNAVKIKAYKIGLSGYLEGGGDYLTLNQLMTVMRGRDRSDGGGYTQIQWEEKGLPVKRRKVVTHYYKVIVVEDFWKWAKKNRTLVDFSKLEKGMLGSEPDWVDEQRKADRAKARYKRTPWTAAEDGLLKSMLRTYKFGYRDISERLMRTEGAIKKRMSDLGIKERPLRTDNHKRWSSEEIENLIEMYHEGHQPDAMKEKIDRTSLSIRAKIERLIIENKLEPRSEYRKTC